MRKRRAAFPSAQMESDIWRRGEIQLEAGVFSRCLQDRKKHAAQKTSVCRSAGCRLVLLLLLSDGFGRVSAGASLFRVWHKCEAGARHGDGDRPHLVLSMFICRK